MDIEKILKYQELDKKVNDLIRQYKASPVVLNCNKLKLLIEDSNKKLVELEDNATKILVNYNKLKSTVEELSSEVEDISSIVENTQTVEDAEYYIKKANELQSKIAALAEELENDNKAIEKISRDLLDTGDKKDKAEKEVITSEEQSAQLKAKVNHLAAPFVKEKNELEKELPAEFFERYKEAKKYKPKFPYFAVYTKDGFCPLCGMELPKNVVTDLSKPDNICSCPSCKGILVVKE